MKINFSREVSRCFVEQYPEKAEIFPSLVQRRNLSIPQMLKDYLVFMEDIAWLIDLSIKLEEGED